MSQRLHPNPRQILRDAILFTEHRQAKTVTVNDVSYPASRALPAAHETPPNRPVGARSSGASVAWGSPSTASTLIPSSSLVAFGLRSVSMSSAVVKTDGMVGWGSYRVGVCIVCKICWTWAACLFCFDILALHSLRQ